MLLCWASYSELSIKFLKQCLDSEIKKDFEVEIKFCNGVVDVIILKQKYFNFITNH